MANKLELTWIGKNDEVKIEPRLLIENKELSNCKNDENTENMIIHGDNLLALKALENKYAGKIKCIYIDPPYNTGSAFEHYDDNLEHSIWLELMKKRIDILYNLLAKDGVIFISINDDEYSYLKILCDEVFGRNNYETTFYIKVRHEDRILREDSRYQLVIEQLLCYRKTDEYKEPRREKKKDPNNNYEYDLEILHDPIRTEEIGGYEVEIYSVNDYRIAQLEKGKGKLKRYTIRGSLITQKGSASEYYEKYLRERKAGDGLGTLYRVKGMGVSGDGLGYRDILQPLKENVKNGLYFQGKPIKEKKSNGLPFPNFYDFTQEFNNAGYEGDVSFRGGKKPEKFIKFVFDLAQLKKGDLVLDSFLGSGTTCAVANKLGFHYIGIEMGEHAYTHCKVRLDKVIEGIDKGGITDEVNWQGGGAYKFYELAPSLIKIDELGNEVINELYDANMLAASVALHEGYEYSPDEKIYWKQSKSNEKSYLYVTTNIIDKNYIDNIHSNMCDDEFLVIACKNYDKNCKNLYKNIIIKKIPQMLLDKCEFSKENYNLNIINPPIYDDAEEEQDD